MQSDSHFYDGNFLINIIFQLKIIKVAGIEFLIAKTKYLL